MVRCGNCGEEGHNVRRCPHSVVTSVMTFGEDGKIEEKPQPPPPPPSPAPEEEHDEEDEKPTWIDISLPEEVVTKFKTIVEFCTEISRELKKGFLECVYEEAVCIELQLRNIQFSKQETIPITYKGRYVGNNRLDILLHTWLPLVIELKATTTTIKTEDRWQVVRYMSRKDVPYGVVVNFAQSIKGSLYLSFIVKHEEEYYQYSLETGQGKKMIDFA